MIPTIFFALMCLGPLTVMGDDDSWLPETVPWPAQQCIDRRLGYVGQCVGTHDDPTYRHIPICRSLRCAQPRRYGGWYAMVRVGMPAEGTICGLLKACKGGSCVDIPPHKIPTQTGVRTTYDCGPSLVTQKPRRKNSTRVDGRSHRIKKIQLP